MRGRHYQGKTYAKGEIFYYLGKGYPLVLSEGDSSLLFDGERFQLFANRHSKDPFPLFLSWYTGKTLEQIQRRVPDLCKTVGVRPTSIHVRFANSRWGSCTSQGKIMFNSRLAAVDPTLIDYVAVHELCHLVHLNHSELFWDEVEKHLPNWRELRKELKNQSPQATF